MKWMKTPEFDHYAHTRSLPEGEFAEGIHAAKHIIFCFGLKLPNPVMYNIMLEWVADLKTAKAKA